MIRTSLPRHVGLRRLQHIAELEPILAPLLEERERIVAKRGRVLPLLIKISPDTSEEDLRALAKRIGSMGLDGVIATNTTLSRPGNATHPCAMEEGGLSGEPLR